MVTEYGLSCIQPSATSLSSALVQDHDINLLQLDAHGTHTLLKPFFNVVPLGWVKYRFEARRNVP
jgi:hypothetical protein